MKRMIAGIGLAVATGATPATALTPLETKQCYVAAAALLPAIPGATIAAMSTTADAREVADAAVAIANHRVGYQYVRSLAEDYALFTTSEMIAARGLAEKGELRKIADMVQKQVARYAESTVMVLMTQRSGVLEARSAYACAMIKGRPLTVPMGIVE